MRFPTDTAVRSARVWMTALFACGGLALAILAPAAQATPEALGVKTLCGANCTTAFEECGSEKVEPLPKLVYLVPKEPTLAEAKEQGYRQAAGHPAWGITDFEIATINFGENPPKEPGKVPDAEPTALVTHVRTDVGPGVSTNPEAMVQCSMKEFGEKEVVPGTGFYEKPTCVETEPGSTVIGENKVVAYAGEELFFPKSGIVDLPLTGVVYNLVQPEGRAADFGVALELPKELTGAKLEEGFKKVRRSRGETWSRRISFASGTEIP